MKTRITFILLLWTSLSWSQNPLFEKYIGKDHRSISEFEDFSDYNDFGGMMISAHGEEIQYGFAHYGKENSQIIIFETVRTVQSKGVYTLIDGLVVTDLDSNEVLMYGQCSLYGEDDSFIVAVILDDVEDEEDYTNILRAWRANPNTKRFEVIETKSISCVNEGFGCAH